MFRRRVFLRNKYVLGLNQDGPQLLQLVFNYLTRRFRYGKYNVRRERQGV